MVLGVICSNGSVMPPHFFGPKEKVTRRFTSMSLRLLFPWMDSWPPGPCTVYTFQQDSAPAHKAKLVQSWLKKNVPNFWDFITWAHNSPDLNPCDYCL
ncbi:Transposable element tcb2 transposase [Caligus rogercresseyi]|uniref:Transposable element tcb2 transposase n=1 Tax=Caligus rogercresseyi TaxID=217165 RepID=A0A7T8HIL8_CALRO|nr:Transposable element tcb2 transposase [Caligus rogercresseyi]